MNRYLEQFRYPPGRRATCRRGRKIAGAGRRWFSRDDRGSGAARRPGSPAKFGHDLRKSVWPLVGFAIMAGLLVATPVFDVSAQSETTVVGTLDASTQGEVARDAAIAVRAPSGGRDILVIADLFREALAESGYQPPADGGYVLSFQLSSDSADPGRRSGFELRGESGSRYSNEVELTMRWKMRRTDDIPKRRRRRLSVSVVDAEKNQVWQARVEMRGDGADDLTMVETVIPALMANFGRTVYALRVP